MAVFIVCLMSGHFVGRAILEADWVMGAYGAILILASFFLEAKK